MLQVKKACHMLHGAFLQIIKIKCMRFCIFVINFNKQLLWKKVTCKNNLKSTGIRSLFGFRFYYKLKLSCSCLFVLFFFVVTLFCFSMLLDSQIKISLFFMLESNLSFNKRDICQKIDEYNKHLIFIFSRQKYSNCLLIFRHITNYYFRRCN